MRYVDEYRQPDLVRALVARIHDRMGHTGFTAEHPLQIMEVCGGHTHAIFKFGLDRLLPPSLEFIHGPGCPVCVLPAGRIDACIQIALRPDVIFCTFGDAMRVPGRQGTLLSARRRGADVRMVWSPLDALMLAKQHPEKQVVFFGIGFETTMPATAVTLRQARADGVTNFFLFCQHITLMPTLISLLSQPDVRIDGFIAPGHVSMVIGRQPYAGICEVYRKPVVITGFEPGDILQGLLMLCEQYADARVCVENQYRRVVPDEGNRLAQQAMDEVFITEGAGEWRGLGVIADSRVSLREAWRPFDAEWRFRPDPQPVADDPRACCGKVLTGRCKPADCPLFGEDCNPQNAFGALMVSSEGACAAWYQYRRSES
ncbi:hydrogenase formation protein HypD [Martelella alba]|uniref:Hydrogenase maturation factor n=1 Tax=Martelella alba TaxID=2590451 RepID=A0ABY2SKA4_9HYPH|nr:hydrogenase formation protein HypD [Martelella alba]TKI05375.1 hydrogenase formation protein HypD [Martelella alba]